LNESNRVDLCDRQQKFKITIYQSDSSRKTKQRGKIFLHEYTHSQILCPLELQIQVSSKFSPRKCISLGFDHGIFTKISLLMYFKIPLAIQKREIFRARDNLRTFLISYYFLLKMKKEHYSLFILTHNLLVFHSTHT